MRWVLGVDGGGTKTVCCALASDGSGVAVVGPACGSSNRNSVGDEAAAEAVVAALHGCLARAAGTDAGDDADWGSVAAVVLGMSGVDRPGDPERVQEWVESAFVERGVTQCPPVQVTNDAVTALASGTRAGARHGVVVIVGTGTITYGEDSSRAKGDVVTARCDGWGPLLGDCGSGGWLGRRALEAVCRAADGRGPATVLTSSVLALLGLSAPEDLIAWRYSSSTSFAGVAAVAPCVLDGAAAGDPVAAAIVDDAVEELGCSLSVVVRALGWDVASAELLPCDAASGDAPRIVLAGGILDARTNPLAVGLTRHARERHPVLDVVHTEVQSCEGAARMALGLLHTKS